MATFYIDYENVHNAGLRGLELLGREDYVYIFYSENANTFNVESMKLALQSVCGIEFIEVEIGIPNAMDFQIVTMVYATINADNYHFIISKDKGFDVAIHMGVKCNCNNVERFPDINQAFASYKRKRGEEKVSGTESGINPNEQITETTPATSTVINIASEIDNGINEEKLSEANKKKIKQFLQKNNGVTVSKENLEITYEGLITCTTKMQLYNFFRTRLGNEAGNKLYKVIGERYYELKNVV